jgi:TolB-like protein/tetratricopeptide (TPR) repeat protein
MGRLEVSIWHKAQSTGRERGNRPTAPKRPRMPADDVRLLKLAEAVADGLGVDWQDAESSADSPDRLNLIRLLRVLADLAELHRSTGQQAFRESFQDPAGETEPSAERASIDRPSQPRPTGRSWGPLQILQEVGSGCFGTVYRALDLHLDREVALKLLHRVRSTEQEGASSIIKEGRLLAQIRHPNVVTVFGADCFDGRVGLWMEFVNGRTLKKIQQEQGPFSAQEAMLIGLDVCRALTAVHKAGFLHRDIKAQNVMREAGGRIVLMDFGAGDAYTSENAPILPLTGTPLYLAPELLTAHEASVASDVYALGVLLYHLVSGRYPFEGDDLEALRREHALERRRQLHDVRPDLPDGFVRTVECALRVDRKRRFNSAGAMQVALTDALGMRFAIEAFAETAPTQVATRASDATPSIAVLPFSDLSQEQNQDYFCEGMAEELINALSGLAGVRVAARSSSFRFKGQAQDIRSVGEQLRVHHVLEGSVRKAGNRLRITAQLINVNDGYHLWSSRYDRDLEDVFALQDEIARAIVGKLKVKLGEEPDRPLVKRQTDNVEAYHLYLRGQYYWSRRYAGFLQRAIDSFEQAIVQDESYALAHAGLADGYSLLAVFEILPPGVAIAKAKPAAERAVWLDDGLADAHRALALVRWYLDWDYAAAEHEYRRALTLNPGSGITHGQFGILLAYLGRFDEAVAEVVRARALEPVSPLVGFYSASTLAAAGSLKEALAECRRVLDLDPDFSLELWMHAVVLSALGRHDEAVEAAERAVTCSRRQNFFLGYAACTYAAAGRRQEAEAIQQEMHQRERQMYVSPMCFAEIATALGDTEQAFEWLERAFDDRSPFLVTLGVNPVYDALRQDRRFDLLLKRLELQNSRPSASA